jgi:asparagine N-glycosylation enzyme membrane subunit Stt3
VIILGSVLTAAISLVVFGRSKLERSAEIALALLGVLAATAAVTWHAHFHMAIILIPPLLLLAVKDQQGSKIFHLLVLVPVLVHLVLAILAPVVTIGKPLLQLVEGLRGFGLKLLILGWAVVRMREGKELVEGKVVGG